MRWPVTLFVAAVVVPLAAWADDKAPTPPVATSQSQVSDLDQVICKRLPPPTGTRLGGKTVCQTKKQWLELETNSQDTLERAQKSSGMPAGGGQ
jgi:hypothetical protein